MTALTLHFVHHRLAWSRSVFLALIVLVAVGSPPKVLQGWPAELSEFLGYFLLVAGQSGLEYFTAIRTAEVGHLFVRTLRRDLFAHLSRLSPLFHAKNKTGDILVRLMGDITLLRSMLIDSSTELATRAMWEGGAFTFDPATRAVARV